MSINKAGSAAAVGVAAFPQGVRRAQQSLAPLPSPPGLPGTSGRVWGWFLLFQGQPWLPRRAEAEQLDAGCKKFGLKPHRSSPSLRHTADARSSSPPGTRRSAALSPEVSGLSCTTESLQRQLNGLSQPPAHQRWAVTHRTAGGTISQPPTMGISCRRARFNCLLPGRAAASTACPLEHRAAGSEQHRRCRGCFGEET